MQKQPVAWFSPTYKMLAEIWRDEVRRLTPITTRISSQEHRLDLMGGGLVDMWSLDAADTVRGRKYARVVIDEAASSAAWCQLWGLTKLAAGSEQSLRGQVVAACVSLLERVGRDEVESELGIEAAWTLVSLKRIEHLELLRRVELKSRWTLAYCDYNSARRALEQGQENPFPQELWELPVRDWFAPRWQRTRDWLVMRDSGVRNWEALQASYAAEPSASRIPIAELPPRTGRKDSRYAAVR